MRIRDATDKDLGRTHCADVNNYVVMSVVDYDAIEPMVEVTNMMTGKKYTESINTPSYMSASSEAYWSHVMGIISSIISFVLTFNYWFWAILALIVYPPLGIGMLALGVVGSIAN